MDDFDERLRQRLTALDAAVPPDAPVVRRKLATPVRPRVVRAVGAPSVGLAAAAVLILVLLISFGFAGLHFAATGSNALPTAAATTSGEATASVPTSSAGEPMVIMGFEGFPVSIDGQPVHRLDDGASWASLTGSFLVAAGAPYGAPSCPVMPTPGPTADAHLASGCPDVILFYTSGFHANSGGTGLGTAPKGLSLDAIAGWGGHIIVVRAHTHDPEAAQCSPAERARCENTLVVESIVWPSVPDQIDGAHVYRGSDQRSGELAGLGQSFLFGGVVRVQPTGQEFSQCSASVAAGDLLPYCAANLTEIDGAEIAPSSEIEAIADEVVVVRAHVNDPLAAQCPEEVRTACVQSVVVEAVVWSSKPFSTARSVPLPTPPGTP